MYKHKAVVIEGRFPGLNEYTNANRTNRFAGANMKSAETERVRLHFLNKAPVRRPCYVQFTWVEKNSRRDPDNIVFARKFILDGMVKAGVLENDNQKWIIGFEDIIDVDPSNPRVVVQIAEVVNAEAH